MSRSTLPKWILEKDNPEPEVTPLLRPHRVSALYLRDERCFALVVFEYEGQHPGRVVRLKPKDSEPFELEQLVYWILADRSRELDKSGKPRVVEYLIDFGNWKLVLNERRLMQLSVALSEAKRIAEELGAWRS